MASAVIPLLLFPACLGQLPASDDVPRLWPQPRSVPEFLGNSSSLALSTSFMMTADEPSDILAYNLKYYREIIFVRDATLPTTPTKPVDQLRVVVDVEAKPDEYPYLGMDESYTLAIASPVSELRANTTWGAIRGLETFSQLIQMNRALVIRGGGKGFTITDAPKFPWRGLMIDPARHFIPVDDILRTIDAMAQNKLNTLHLHLTDGESFSVDTQSWSMFRELSVKGAYAPGVAYSASNLRSIVAHARLRGVRVIPEFDLPAHMASWAQGVPDIITDCPSVNPYPQWPRYYSPANPANERLYEVIETILSELHEVFPDSNWHVGGDEPHEACWDANAEVRTFKLKHGNMTNDDLYVYFENRYLQILQKYNKSRIGWDEIFTIGGGIAKNDSSTIVHVWNGNEKLADVVAAGLRGIVSSKWYLNDGGDWSSYYTDDPLSYVAKSSHRELVLGGEACMWASAFDMSSNMEPAIWPNAAAMAEQLWSEKIESIDHARTRLSQQRCRMVRRGVRASPIAEDLCMRNIYVRKSRSFAYPGDFPVSPDTPGP